MEVELNEEISAQPPKAIRDGSSDEDEGVVVKKRSSKKKVLKDSDEESDPGPEEPSKDSSDEGESAIEPLSSSVGKPRRIKRIDSDDDSGPDDSPAKASYSFQNNDLFDAEVSSGDEEQSKRKQRRYSSDSDGETREEDDEDGEVAFEIHHSPVKSDGKEKKKSRKSKAQAMKEIRSESQRQLRESSLALPYHKPKQRTLDEFLNRKKGTPELLKSYKLTPQSIGTEAEKALEEREKIAEEFFKSDDEEDSGNAKIQDSGILTGPETSDDSAPDNTHTDDSQTPLPPPEAVNERASEDKSEEEHGQNQDLQNKTLTEKSASEKDTQDLHLLLENDTEELDTTLKDDDEMISSSQISEAKGEKTKNSAGISKKLAAMGLDISLLKDTLNKTPKLNATEEDVEFNEEPKKNLVSRMIKHAKARKAPVFKKKDVKITVVSKEVDAEGHEHLKKESFNYKPSNANLLEGVKKLANPDKPGVQRLALKQALKAKMADKRRAEREKRAEMKKLENEEGFEGDVEDEEEEEEMTESEEEEESEPEEEPMEDDVVFKEKKRNRNEFIDDEASDDEDHDEDIHLALEDDGESEDEDPSPLKALKKSLTSDNSMSDLFASFGRPDNATPTLDSRHVSKTSATPSEDTPMTKMFKAPMILTPTVSNDEGSSTQPSQSARKKLGFEGLFDKSDPQVDDLDDVVGLCSGNFMTQNNQFLSQMTQPNDTQSQELDLLAVQPSNDFNTPDTVIMSNNKPATENSSMLRTETQDTIILDKKDDFELLPWDSDFSNSMTEAKAMEVEEEERAPGFMEDTPGFLDSDEEEDKSKDPSKKKRKRLVMSDDSEQSDCEESDAESTAESEKENVEPDDVEYDSEENEVQKSFTPIVDKKGGIRREFLENEAELSGSEIGSDDEDERGLDRLEAEAGDFDDIDEDEVRDQLGRLHQRKLLDEDKRDVRLFQEAFLEDGELHSDKTRERRFRWKGMDDNDELNPRRLSDDEAEDDAETEEKRRLERIEREKFVQEAIEKEESEQPAEEDSQFFNMANKVLKKLDSKKEVQKGGKDPKIFKSPKAKMPLQMLSSNQRGSFLSRTSAKLDKLAELTKSKSDGATGSTAKKSRNFVFAALSPEKGSEDRVVEEVKTKKKKSVQPAPKKAKMDSRTLDENSMDTIFGLM